MFGKRLWRNSKGQSLVEFALISLLMVVIILGTLDMGIILFRQNGLSSLAKDVARAASVGETPANLEAVARRDAEVIFTPVSSDLTGNQITIKGSNGTTIKAVISPQRHLRKKGELVEVTVTYNYTPVSFFLPNQIQMTAKSKTLMEKSTL